MPSVSQSLLLLSLLGPLPLALATTVQRCEAADGRITFTTLSCAAGERASLQHVRTFTPGSTVALMPPAEPRESSAMNLSLIHI